MQEEVEVPATEPEVIEPTIEPKRKPLCFFTLLFLLIVITAVFGFLGYQFWQTSLQQARAIKNLQAKTQQFSQDSQTTLNQFSQNLEQTKAQLQNQGNQLAELRNVEHANRNDLQIAVAEYLTKIANVNLQYENNPTQAINFLNQSDQELANSNDPNVLPIRQAVAADLAKLKTLPKIDKTSIFLQLSQLSMQIDKLPVNSRIEKNATMAAPSATLPWWKKGLINSWQALKNLIVVRKNNSNKAPFVTPDESVMLYQNLHAQLSYAQWAVLHEQSDLYKTSLQQVQNWIKEYCVANDSITQQVLNELNQLQQVTIQADLPNLSQSIAAFDVYWKQKTNNKT